MAAESDGELSPVLGGHLAEAGAGERRHGDAHFGWPIVAYAGLDEVGVVGFVTPAILEQLESLELESDLQLREDLIDILEAEDLSNYQLVVSEKDGEIHLSPSISDMTSDSQLEQEFIK